jgi:hypothetical protein
VIFDQPQRLKRISLVFVEPEAQRTQEFTLKWSPDHGKSFREIVRQQRNFSSPDATRETEDHAVELSNVTLLELTIDPDKQNGCSRLPFEFALGLIFSRTLKNPHRRGPLTLIAATIILAKHASRKRIAQYR